MSETKAEYRVDSFDSSVRCECGLTIGQYVTENKQTWIAVNILRAETIHGKCGGCGRPFHFCASDKRLETLVNKITKGYTESEIEV